MVLSWLLAALVWPLLLVALPAAQGLGVAVVGGEWIGLAAPWGAQPWALVNQPGVGFAATRAALWGYWLPPWLLAALLALLLPPFVPSGKGWASELALFHLAMAAAVLGLGYAPALGVEDGPAAGLRVFWRWPTGPVLLALGAVGGVGAAMACLRLASPLWLAPGGPTRRRRVLLALLHAGVPLVLWLCAVHLQGWRPRPPAPLAAIGVFGAAVVGVAWLVARAPLVRRPAAGALTYLAAALCAAAIGGLLGWAGASRQGAPAGFLWGEERTTSNVRRGTVRTILKPLPARTTPPAPSAPGS